MRVPATIMTSDCLGDGRNTAPYLSKSYLEEAVCIISTAQQARPKVIGQSEPERAIAMSSSNFAMK